MQVSLNGEQVTLGPFSAFKAVQAMRIVETIEQSVRQLVDEGGDFRREYRERHFIELTRAEARRMYPPDILIRQVEQDDGRVAVEPMMDSDGQVMVGPDPLGHLTEEDWEGSGQLLRIPSEPDENSVLAVLVPRGFAVAEGAVMRILALITATNADLERWDEEGTVDAELDKAARALLHRASAEELIGLAVAAVGMVRSQVAGPFARARAEIAQILTPPETAAPADQAPEPEPMTIESSAGSSTSSQDGTGGTPAPSSTEPVGASS